MKYFKKLVGKKIYLSPMSTEDVEQYTEWISDLEIAVPLGNGSHLYSLEKEREVVERLAKEEYNFAIVDKESDELLGNCSLFDISFLHQKAEIGVFVGRKDKWGEGVATEAMTLILEFGFKVLNLHSVLLKVFSFNERAIEVYKRIGFTEIGRRKESYRVNNKWFDDLYFQIFESDLKSKFLDEVLPE